jgi:hypothetical protein
MWLEPSNEINLEINPENVKYIFIFLRQNAD